MTDQIPGVHVTKGGIDEFCDGIFGVNRRANEKAWKDAAAIVVATVALRSSRAARKALRSRRGK
jgi:hypothetical protein